MNLSSISIRWLLLFFLVLLQARCEHFRQLTIVDRSRSVYQIVISMDATDIEKKAARELQSYFQKSSGVLLPICTDETQPIATEIIVGQNRRLQDVGVVIDLDRLQDDGFTIKTINNKLMIIGGKKKGTLYGVYSFIEQYLHCRMYAPDAVMIPKRETIRIHRMDDTQIPRFSYRETLHYFPLTSQEYCDWHKLHSAQDRRQAWGMYVHTFDKLVPPDEYFDKHPEYFSEIKGLRLRDGQLCLSNPDVFDITVRNLRKMIAENPGAQFWSVSQNDNFNYCTCDKCRAIDEKYGSHSGSVIEFVNRVARQFPEKMISTLAYLYSRAAPTGIVPEPNVNIMLCTIECDRSRPLEKLAGDDAFQKDLQDWGRLTSNIYLWDYVVQFRNYLDPFPNLHVLQPNLKFFARNNCRMIFEQGSGGSISEFHELRTYLIAKLLWNPDINLDAVMNDFLYGYYGDAGSFIRKYIDRMHQALVVSGKRLDIYGYPFSAIDSYLTPALLKEYEQLFDGAEQAVRDDSLLLQRVKRARLPLEFAVLDISMHNINEELSFVKHQHGEVISRDDMLTRVEAFVRACAENNIERLEEHGYSPEEFQANVKILVEKSLCKNLAFGKPVSVLTEWSEKYPVGGGKALTDGVFGVMDCHFNWLGFENADLEAVIDLGALMVIQNIRADFMQYPLAWIFLPLKIEYSVSDDGKTFVKAATIITSTPPDKGKVFLETFSASFEKTTARYIKIYAESMKLCPDWHRGAGQPAWIFTDEVIVE